MIAQAEYGFGSPKLGQVSAPYMLLDWTALKPVSRKKEFRVTATGLRCCAIIYESVRVTLSALVPRNHQS